MPHPPAAVAADPTSRPALLPAPQGLLRWLPVAGLGLVLLGLARRAGDGITDPDTLWHILAGRYLRSTWQFVGPDPLSSFTTQPWVLNQWLPELVMSWLHQWGGLRAVAWGAYVAMLCLCLAVYATNRQRSGPLAAVLTCGLAVVGMAGSLSPRPQLAGFLLLAVTVRAWLNTGGDLKPRWWLVALTWLWACCHGTWVVGPAVGAVVTAGLLADRRIGRGVALRLLAVVCGGAVAAAVLTPVGPALVTSFGTVRAVSPYIQEWRHPELTDPSLLACMALALAVVCGWLRVRRGVSWVEVGLTALGLVWALLYARTVGVGALILAPLAAVGVERVLGRARPRLGRERWVVLGVFAAAVALAAGVAAAGPREPVGVPAGVSSSLSSLPSGSVVYNEDTLGGWLMWAHPQLRQTADTRAELYGPQAARAYLRTYAAAPGWEARFDGLHPAAALLAEKAPLVRALESRGWRVRARDAGYALLEP